jgi:PiT family inorganic phosphate transporter
MATATPALEAKLGRRPGMIGVVGFGAVLLVGVVYSAFYLLSDLSTVHSASITPYVLLAVALLVALGLKL